MNVVTASLMISCVEQKGRTMPVDGGRGVGGDDDDNERRRGVSYRKEETVFFFIKQILFVTF